MNRYTLRVLTLIVVSVLVVILLASALNSFTRVTDSALAHTAPTPGTFFQTPLQNAPRTAPGKNYLPIIFLNSANAGGAWLLAGNAGTNPATDFLGTTDNMTLTLRVSNTVAYRIVPAADPTFGFAPNIIGGSAANTISPGLWGATIAGGGLNSHPNLINSYGNYATIGGGRNNTASSYATTVGGGDSNTASNTDATIGGGVFNAASNYYATISGGYNNVASGQDATVGGGDNNLASGQDATVGGGNSNTASNYYATVGGGAVNTASNFHAAVGGGTFNIASGGGAFVGGGGWNGSSSNGNRANGNASTIGGGWGNVISSTSSYAFIGGGDTNAASGQWSTIGGGLSNNANGYANTIGGGDHNTASNGSATVGGGVFNSASGQQAIVGGGGANTASGDLATVGGGGSNTASGYVATVPGGSTNVASGDYSFAAGQHANTNNQTGAFVWADAITTTVLNATVANQFLVRASGGITMYTNSAATVGASLYPGSGSWNNLSNKNLKANFANVDSRDILARLANLPITTWNYKTQDASIRHIGPMAQDFAAAFKVGENDTTISTVDAQGVALAAIQGLAQENQNLQAQVVSLQSTVNSLQSQNASLKSQVTGLQSQNATFDARLSAVEQASGIQSPGAFSMNNLPLYGIVGLLALWLVRKRKA